MENLENVENTGNVDNKDARMWAFIAHLLGFAGFFVPFGNIIGPLVVMLAKGEEHPFIKENAKEALNFQISMQIYAIISAILIIVAIGVVLLPALLIFDVIVIIIAAIAANEGRAYRYPLCIRFVS